MPLELTFEMVPDDATSTTHALIERACIERLSVQDVRRVSDDLGARVACIDERDRHVRYDMTIARVNAQWHMDPVRLRVHVRNDWDDVIDVFDRCDAYDRTSWAHALINGRLYTQVARSRRVGGARIY